AGNGALRVARRCPPLSEKTSPQPTASDKLFRNGLSIIRGTFLKPSGVCASWTSRPSFLLCRVSEKTEETEAGVSRAAAGDAEGKAPQPGCAGSEAGWRIRRDKPSPPSGGRCCCLPPVFCSDGRSCWEDLCHLRPPFS